MDFRKYPKLFDSLRFSDQDSDDNTCCNACGSPLTEDEIETGQLRCFDCILDSEGDRE